jgi:hypothetical protein
MIEINRLGYGSAFNKISIDKANNIIKKECINDYGLKKMSNEIKFYKHLKLTNSSFPIPNIIEYFSNGYTMMYIDSKPLYLLFFNLDKDHQKKIIFQLQVILNDLHNSEQIIVTKEKFYNCLHEEIYKKIINRYESIKHVVEKDQYKLVTHVNNIKIMQFDNLLDSLNKKIKQIIEERYSNSYYFTQIHGDCQFNNILSNLFDNDFIFIDPRGYYGDSEIYGLKEYDIAKLYFALSGYDEFDNRYIDNLEINNTNINIQIVNYFDNNDFVKDELAYLLMITIWMGNAHSFICNEKKAIYSYFISLLIGTQYFADQ